MYAPTVELIEWTRLAPALPTAHDNALSDSSSQATPVIVEGNAIRAQSRER